jgi:hypothetical protein
MLQTSAEFHRLQLSCATTHDLISNLHPHLMPDNDHILRLKSYLILCHAAIEEYLEKVSLSILKECLERFKEQKVIPKALWAASSYYTNPMHSDFGLFRGSQDFWIVCERIFSWSIESHRVALSDVHGIKTKHQDKMFLPIGLRVHDFDHLLSQSLNAFGEGRGKIAHEFRIEHRLPRAALEQSVNQILRLLLPFDQELNRICLEDLQL